MEILVAVFYAFLLYLLYKCLEYVYRLPRVSDLDSRYILMTGCDSGFGRAAAKKLDSLGCHVIAACLTEHGETQLRKTCSNKLKTLHMDISKHQDIMKAYDYVKQILPPGRGLSGILNNAGVLVKHCPADWQTMQDYRKTINVNLLGTIDVTSTFLPLIKKEKGRIVNTASMAGWFATPYSCAYNVSKYGVEAYSDTIRRELKVFGVSVHIVEPGAHRTNMSHPDDIMKSLTTIYNDLPLDKQKEYGEVYVHDVMQTYRKLLPKSEYIGMDLSPVVNAYVHALLGRFPRARYVAGLDAKYLFKPLSYLPEPIGDWLVVKIMLFANVLPKSCR